MADRLVMDTCVLVEYENGESDATAYVNLFGAKGLLVVHPVSVMELLDGVHDLRHLTQTLALIAAFPRVPVKNADHDLAVQFMVNYRLSHNIDWPDCLIAATCIRLGLPLVTRNDKHFRAIRGLRVVRPY